MPPAGSPSPPVHAHLVYLYILIACSPLFFLAGGGVAALGLCRCVQAFSSCGEQGLLSSCSGWISHCGSFSYGRAQALRPVGFSSCLVWTQ